MLRLYSDQKIEKILNRYSRFAKTLSERYSVPVPFLFALLRQEMEGMDLLDPVADFVVRLNLGTLAKRYPDGVLPAGHEKESRYHPFRKTDSSTGYAQIYAFVGINALNFAVKEGLASYEQFGLSADHTLQPGNLKDLWTIWNRLNREPEFNMELATLNLLSAAKEKTRRIDFAGYSPEEIKRIYTRYNGTSSTITEYGESAYRHYLAYCKS